jgi:hypothetical protein
MNKKVLSLLVLLMVLTLSACASEKIELRIVTPTQGFRVSSDFVEGQSVPVPLEIYYQGSDPQKVALVKVNGIGPIPCNLVSGIVNNCGTFGITQTGDQEVYVSVSKSDGNFVTSKVNFVWTPLQGIEKVASSISGVFGPKNLGVGYVFLSILALIIFVIIIAASVKGLSAVAIIVWVSTTILTMTFFVIGTEAALTAFNYMLTFWGFITVICLIGFGMSKGYTLTKPTANVLFVSLGDGQSIKYIKENGRILGPDQTSQYDPLPEQIIQTSAEYFMKKNFPKLKAGEDYQTIYLPEEKQ